MVEAKIFKEDDLESQLERYRKLVDQATSQGFIKPSSRHSSTAASESNVGSAKSSLAPPLEDPNACELCNEPGHDVRSAFVSGT